MFKSSVLVICLPALLVVAAVFDKSRQFNSFQLMSLILLIAVVVGVIFGLMLLLLKRGSHLVPVRLLYILGIIGFIFCYIDLTLYENYRDFFDLFGFVEGARPVSGVLLLGALTGAVGLTLALLLWFFEDETIGFLTILFTGIFLATAFLYPPPPLSNFEKAGIAPDVPASEGTTIIIILDSMIGAAGLRTDIPENFELADDIDDFFAAYGFTHFDRAFSRHHLSRKSIPAIFNGMSEAKPDFSGLVTSWRLRHRLWKNEVFDTQLRAGASINVHQNDYLDYCQHDAVRKCTTVSTTNPYSEKLMDAQASPGNIVMALRVLRKFLGASFVVKRVSPPVLDRLIFAAGKARPDLELEAATFTALFQTDLAFDAVFDDFAKDVMDAGDGTHFAHFLFPHHPFRVDATCHPVTERLRDVERYDNLVQLHGYPPAEAEERRWHLYGRYRDQVRCAYNKLSVFFDDLREQGRYDNARIILLGDHGSRISFAEVYELASARDLIDNFSTLFAVKTPEGSASVDHRVVSVQQLLVAYLSDNPDKALQNTTDTLAIYSRNEKGDVLVPMPDFQGLP